MSQMTVDTKQPDVVVVQPDVVVVGGGPAGSTAAAFLANGHLKKRVIQCRT